jgi:hypothetical protein
VTSPNPNVVGTKDDPDVKASGVIVLGALAVLIGLHFAFRKITD